MSDSKTIEIDEERIDEPGYRARVLRELMGEDACRRGTHHIIDLKGKVSAVTVGMSCEWQDGKPEGSIGFLDRVIAPGSKCYGLMDASFQHTAPVAILFVQQEAEGGETGMLSSVQWGFDNDDDGKDLAVRPEDRIVLPEVLEGSDGFAVLFHHSDPSRMLDVPGLMMNGMRYLRDWLVEDDEDYFMPFWLDDRYRENNPTGMLFFGQCLDPSVDGTGITICAFKSTDEIARVSQLGWEQGDMPMAHLDIYGIDSEAGFGAVISAPTGGDYRLDEYDEYDEEYGD